MRAIEQPGGERILRRRLRVVQHARDAAAAPHRSASAPAIRRPTRRNRRPPLPRRPHARTAARRCPRTVPATSTQPGRLAVRRELGDPPMRQRHARRRQVERPRRRASFRSLRRPRRRRAPPRAAPPASPSPARRRTAGRRRCDACPSRNRADSRRRDCHSPRCSARPVTPNRAACSTISGNSVTTSIRILRSGRGVQ